MGKPDEERAPAASDEKEPETGRRHVVSSFEELEEKLAELGRTVVSVELKIRPLS